MTVNDLIKQEIDIDVYDDVCEELAIAFCGPLELTEAGKEKFREVLEYEIKLHNGPNYSCPIAIVHIDDPDDAVWKIRLKKAMQFFYAAAGYCEEEDYSKWFKEEEE